MPNFGSLLGNVVNSLTNSTTGRSGYNAGYFALELDNQASPVGFVTQIDGGTFQADAVEHHTGMQQHIAKYAARPKFGDITIGIGMPSSAKLFSWVQSVLSNTPERHTGAIVGFDNFNNCRERSRRVFDQALLSEITFPALAPSSGGSSAPANITLKITPENLTYQSGSAVFTPQQGQDEATKQKAWSTSSFGFRLDGFWGTGPQKNMRVESFSVKQTILDNSAGNSTTILREPGRLEYPNLVVTWGESHMDTWYKWYQDSVVNRNPTFRSGALMWNDPQGSELMRLEIDGVSLLGLDIAGYQAGQDKMAQAKATLCVESMKLVPGAGNV